MASDIAPKLSQLRPAAASAKGSRRAHVPRPPRLSDLLTTANLACGVSSVLLASQGQLTIACGLVFLGALFDVFDGLAARALGGGSPLGAQLDSLADMVTFGMAPAFAVWSLHTTSIVDQRNEAHAWVVALAVLLIPIASAWRLAKFNIDPRQTSGFLGLPTPANALFWASIPLILAGDLVVHTPGRDLPFGLVVALFAHPFLLLMTTVVLGALMLSELPLPSLKFKHGGWKGNEVIFLLLGLGAVLVALYGILAVPLLLALYLLSPLWGRLFPASSRPL